MAVAIQGKHKSFSIILLDERFYMYLLSHEICDFVHHSFSLKRYANPYQATEAAVTTTATAILMVADPATIPMEVVTAVVTR